MSEQIDLLSSPDGVMSEHAVFELLMPVFSTVLYDANIPHEMLTLEPKKGFSSIMLSSYLVARLYFRDAKSYIEIPAGCAKRIPAALLSCSKCEKPNFLSISIISVSSITQYGAFWGNVLNFAIDRIPTEFDCCSRYLECSDAKHCITPLKVHGMGCGYKKVLRSGRIFYGANRNID